jgi:hypothetical protein|nr:MAG TPA: hypothetical protein [Caudoviricetes sp.]
MSINAGQLMDEAAVSLNNGRETAYRAAVHQAYYALFHRALFFANCFLRAEIKGSSQHKQLYEFMCNHSSGAFRAIGIALRSAAAYRVQADYEWSETVVLEHAEDHVASCKLILQKVEAYIESFQSSAQETA